MKNWILHHLFFCLSLVVLFLAGGWYWLGIHTRLEQRVKVNYSVEDPAFTRTISALLGFPLTEGNKVTTLVNGDKFFPAMIEAIQKAQKSITLETYIWESGTIGCRFVELIAAKAREGVVVLIIVDGMGTLKFDDADINLLETSGAQLVKFKREHWYKVKPNLNHRTHRKILVVDGKVGFTGGACIADKWMGNAEGIDRWRDTQFKIEGPAVAQLQSIFSQNWLETTGNLLEGDLFFPRLEKGGDKIVQCFESGPLEGDENARLLFLYSIAAAQKSIRIAHAYFVPDDLAINAFIDAHKRGVDIEVIVPGVTDSAIGRAASRPAWERLAEAGIKIFEYQGLLHCKLMIIDGMWTTAGSINFDNRSFKLNDEANFNVWDREFASDQLSIWEKDKQRSRALTADQLNGRGWVKKTGDRMASLLKPIL